MNLISLLCRFFSDVFFRIVFLGPCPKDLYLFLGDVRPVFPSVLYGQWSPLCDGASPPGGLRYHGYLPEGFGFLGDVSCFLDEDLLSPVGARCTSFRVPESCWSLVEIAKRSVIAPLSTRVFFPDPRTLIFISRFIVFPAPP